MIYAILNPDRCRAMLEAACPALRFNLSLETPDQAGGRVFAAQTLHNLEAAMTMWPAAFRTDKIMRTAFPALAYGLDALA